MKEGIKTTQKRVWEPVGSSSIGQQMEWGKVGGNEGKHMGEKCREKRLRDVQTDVKCLGLPSTCGWQQEPKILKRVEAFFVEFFEFLCFPLIME